MKLHSLQTIFMFHLIFMINSSKQRRNTERLNNFPKTIKPEIESPDSNRGLSASAARAPSLYLMVPG